MSVKVETKVSDTAQDITVPKLKRDRKIKLPPYDEVKMVTGIFRNIEYPGTGFTFPFRGGWKGPIKKFTMFDGLEYTIPKELADHLNKNCAYKKMKWVASDGTETVNAMPVTSSSMPNFKQVVDKKTSRFIFQITG